MKALPKPSLLTNLLAAGLLITASLTAHAGTRDAGGGTGIEMDGRLVVLDLVESGVEKNPYLPNIAADPRIVRLLEENLRAPQDFKDEIIPALAVKLTDINQAVQPAGMYMAAAFSYYEVKITSLKLNNIDDTDSAIGEPKVQIAERKGSQIWINRDSWNRLDMVNKVALMTHEIIYPFQPAPTAPQEVTSYGGLLRPYQTSIVGGTEVDVILATSAKTRVLNGYFYKPDWRKNWQKRLDYDMNYSDSAATFSALYGLMSESVGNKNRVVGFQRDGEKKESWETLDRNLLIPTFREIEVEAIRSKTGNVKATLRAESSTREIYGICQRLASPAETERTYSNAIFFSVPSGERLREEFDARISTKNMTKDLSRVSLVDSANVRTGTNTLAMFVTSGKLDECARYLKSVQKDNLVR